MCFYFLHIRDKYLQRNLVGLEKKKSEYQKDTLYKRTSSIIVIYLQV